MTETVAERKGSSLSKVPGLNAFRLDLEKFTPQFASMLADTMDPGQFVELVTTAFINTPKLAQCDPASLMLAVRRSAQLRLRPDGVEGALIPRGKKVTFEPMWQGIIRSMLRTGTVKKIEARVVKLEDAFEFGYGLDPYLRHTPHTPSGERTATVAAYAIVWLTNGERQFEVMDIDELEHIRDISREQNYGKEGPAWRNYPDEMRRKTVVKRLSKYIEQDAQLATVIAYDNSLDSGRPMDPADMLPEMEVRTIDQRATDHADRQTSQLREAIAQTVEGEADDGPDYETQERSSGLIALGDEIAFGKFKGTTWLRALTEERGYVTHWALTDECTALTDEQKASLAKQIEALALKEES